MPFAYREITISGATSGVEGTSKLIQEFKNVMVNNMGWTLTDDQTARGGTSHQLTLQSNGETGTHPTFYFTLTSGTGTTSVALQNVINVRAGTAWDNTTHRIAASGVGAPSLPTSSGITVLTTSANTNYTAWISGDKDGVIMLTKVVATYDHAYLGRIHQFTNPATDEFPIYVSGQSQAVDSLSLATSQVHSFYNGSTPILSTDAGVCSVFGSTPLNSNMQPDTNIFGATESYVAFPIFANVADNSFTPDRKSVRGFLSNVWVMVGKSGPLGSFAVEDTLTTGDGKTYQLFFDSVSSSRTLVIRRS